MGQKNGWTSGVSAFVIGIGVGTAIGMLLAPKSGSDTRRYLADSAQDGLDNALASGQRWAQRASDAADQVRDQINQVKDHVKGATEAGQRAYDEAMRGRD